MPRPLRPIGERLVYHVINRGNNRAPVFSHDDDYAAFLNAIADLKRRRPFELYGYCLMTNHFHLLLRPIDAPGPENGSELFLENYIVLTRFPVPTTTPTVSSPSTTPAPPDCPRSR